MVSFTQIHTKFAQNLRKNRCLPYQAVVPMMPRYNLMHYHRRSNSCSNNNSSPPPREVLEWLYTIGWGVTPLQTKVTTVGKNEIYHWKNLVKPFLVHKLLGSKPPPSPLQYFAASTTPLALPRLVIGLQRRGTRRPKWNGATCEVFGVEVSGLLL